MSGSDYGNVCVVPPQSTHTASIILLHGLCDSGESFSRVTQGLQLPHVKFLFPTAPQQPISCLGGETARGWFNMFDNDSMLKGEKDEEGLKKSVDYLGVLIQQEIDSGIPANRIVIGGFSQGGYLAAKEMLQTHHPLPACLMLSTWLEGFSLPPTKVGQEAVYWIGHGTSDVIMPPHWSTLAEMVLKGKGCRDVRKKIYNGLDHSIAPSEMSDLQDFLKSVLPPTPRASRATAVA